MRIIVTDSGTFWNHENPYLEQYKEAVLIVCLSGQKVTDKYECFVSPYGFHGLGGSGYGIQTAKYQALDMAADKLNNKLHYHEDILFLTDNNPESLYPFSVIRSRNEYNYLHLCTFSPWKFESSFVHKTHASLLRDLSSLSSLLYWDSRDILAQLSPDSTLPDAIRLIQEQYGRLLPKIIRGIHSIEYATKYYFDFASESYIPTEEGFSGIDVTKKDKNADPIDFPISPSLATLGMVVEPKYPDTNQSTKDTVEALIPRIDGKNICSILRSQRIALAQANHIPFESVNCPSTGPCAGTCAKCDKEAAYLSEKIMEIPEEQRVYPPFDPKQELSS